MPTIYNGRPSVSTTWGGVRLGGAYLVNKAGEYILTKAGERIIIKVPGGDLPIVSWGGRTLTNTSWNGRNTI